MPDSAGGLGQGGGRVGPELPQSLSGGVVRSVLVHPDPMLRELCQPAGYLPGPDLRRLAADLLATMYAAGGRGLAAPQIGVMRRAFVMDAGWKQGRPAPLVMLDPEILFYSDQVELAEERCLSIPDRPVTVPRPAEIVLAWYDIEGRHQNRRLAGAEARIAQHEADHLDGRLILDFLP